MKCRVWNSVRWDYILTAAAVLTLYLVSYGYYIGVLLDFWGIPSYP